MYRKLLKRTEPKVACLEPVKQINWILKECCSLLSQTSTLLTKMEGN